MTDWQKKRLQDICSLIVDCPHSTPVWTKKGHIVLRNQNIKSGRLNLSEPSYTDSLHFLERVRRGRPSSGDIVITREAPMGEVCMIPEGLECCLGQRQVLLRPDPKMVNGRYLFFALQSASAQHQISWSEGTGSTVSNLRIPHLKALSITFPDRNNQDRISRLLGALDDKIELNRRMNETLEAMARALFKGWFVDFGPVRAKMEGRQPPGLAPEVAALFPNALNEDGVPVGWKAGRLADIAESRNNGVLPSNVAPDTPYIGLEHLPRRSIALSGWDGAGKVTSNKSRFFKGEILFGKLRPYFHKVGIAPLDGICSTDIVVLGSKSSAWTAFVLMCVSSDEFVAYTDQTSNGTKMPRTSWEAMSKYSLSLPHEKVAFAFNEVVQPMLAMIQANVHENRALAALRDLLLPKLLSGEVRISDAERIAEEIL